MLERSAASVSTGNETATKQHRVKHCMPTEIIVVVAYRDVKRSSSFQTSILKFEFDLHTFGIRSSD